MLKPAESTPLTAVRLGELLIEAGLPAGVLNILTGFGDPAGSAIAQHPDIDKVSFTGSTQTGRTVLEASIGTFKHVTLELGGKSPNIVFDDADLEAAVAASLTGFVAITGQVCLAGTRLFVQDTHPRRVRRGDGGERVRADRRRRSRSGHDGGPAARRSSSSNESRRTSRSERSEGAVAAIGGDVPDRLGYFVEPTVFVGVNNEMQIARDEIFGPVLSVISFADEDEAIALANDTEYGLAAAVWTGDLRRAHTVARRIKAGTVWVNDYFKLEPTMPFGGFKQSGVGRDFGLDWYLAYTEAKSIFVTL